MAVEPRSDELAGYRPVSRLAVAALAAGCGSGLVLFTPLAAMLPLVAIVLAVAALAELRRGAGRIVGRWAALGGLALAVGFVSQAAAAALADRWVAGRRAMATATTWIDSIRAGRLADALAASSPLALPPLPHEHHGEEPAAGDRLAAFGELAVVRAIAAAPEPPAITSLERSDDAWRVRLVLSDGEPSGSILLAVEPRVVSRGSRVIERWLVAGFTLESSP
jgi:hypothetical protein